MLWVLWTATNCLADQKDKDTIQTLLNGVFDENKLPHPTTIVKCIDDDSAHKIVNFIGKFLDKAARGSLSDLVSLPQMIKDFGNSLPPEIGQCLDGNAELDALGTKYNPKNKTSDQIEKEVIEYVTLHYLTVHKWMGDLDSLWRKGDAYQTGFNGGKYGHEVLGLPAPAPHGFLLDSQYRRWTKVMQLMAI
jgi:hypothetical protein